MDAWSTVLIRRGFRIFYETTKKAVAIPVAFGLSEFEDLITIPIQSINLLFILSEWNA
jgi:hypothetical protein